MKRYRKLVSLVLTVLMVLALLPASLSAQETGTEAAASGESGLPEQYIAVEPQLEGASEPATGAVEAINLSEMHLFAGGTKGSKRFSWYETDGVQGGNASMSIAALTRWDDPVNEIDNPYPTSNYTDSNIVYNSSAKNQLHIQEVTRFPVKGSYTGHAAIKQAIQDYGAAHISLWWDFNYEYKGTYYLPESAAKNNYRFSGNDAGGHAVTLVGWDDNYPRTNFKVAAPANGAYIIKNSWGSSAGNNGYYYVSYYDYICMMGNTLIGTRTDDGLTDAWYSGTGAVFYNGVEPSNNYSNIYGFDDYGAVANATSTTTDFKFYASKYTAAANEYIQAVAVNSYRANDEYRIWVVPLAAISSNLPSKSSLGQSYNASKVIASPGYHTIKLTTPLQVTNGQCFAVIVAVRNQAQGKATIPLEINDGDWVTHGTFKQNQSYILYSGTDADWLDLGITYNFTDGVDYYYGTPADVCIKAFGSPVLTGGSEPVVGGSEPVVGGSEPVVGGSEPVVGGSESVVGGSESVVGGSDLTPGKSSPTVGESTLGIPPANEEIETNKISHEVLAPPRAFAAIQPVTSGEPVTGGVSHSVGGTIPEPYDYFNGMTLDDIGEVSTGAATPPAKFNLKDTGRVTSVKDQAGYGACWTFATMASIESAYLTKNGLDNNTTTVEFLQSKRYLNNALDSSITLTANAPLSASVPTYSWTVKNGSTSVNYTPSTTNSIIFNYKTGTAETELQVEGKVVYKSGDIYIWTYRIPVTNYGTGDGSAAHPFEVSTPMGLQLIDCFSGKDSKDLTFKQLANLTAPTGWNPIGESGKPFIGAYDGGSFVITMPDNTGTGLFDYTDGAVIQNVLVNAGAQSLNFSGVGTYQCGVIAANASNTTIQNCSVSGTLNYTLKPNSLLHLGGIVGAAYNTTIDHCGFAGSISVKGISAALGGLVGESRNSTVKTSFFSGSISSDGAGSVIGGLISTIPINPGESTQVNDCYTTGALSGGVTRGGLVGAAEGSNKFTGCYADVKFSGYDYQAAFSSKAGKTSVLTNCYYNSTSAGTNLFDSTVTTGKMKPLTAQQMKNQKSFTGFNFSSVWVMVPGQNNSMPALQRPLGSLQNPLVPPITFSILDFNHNIYVTETSTVEGFFTPEFIWPRPINLVETENSCVKSDGNGSVTGIKRGNTKLSIVADGKSVLTGISFSVYDKKGDLDHNGTSDYLDSVKALIAFLTGKATPTEDACWLLDANNSCGDAFTATTENLSLTDLLMMQQASAGIRNLNSAG